jgi:phosphoribosyl 1,2-cyclic phosphodiesterase
MSTIDTIKIRMYRHGFGDCFLLRFYKGTSLKFKMLIDCGLKLNDSMPGVPITDVVDDIIKETKVKKGSKTVPHLDVLVVTHEHWDHVSAFSPEGQIV